MLHEKDYSKQNQFLKLTVLNLFQTTGIFSIMYCNTAFAVKKYINSFYCHVEMLAFFETLALSV